MPTVLDHGRRTRSPRVVASVILMVSALAAGTGAVSAQQQDLGDFLDPLAIEREAAPAPSTERQRSWAAQRESSGERDAPPVFEKRPLSSERGLTPAARATDRAVTDAVGDVSTGMKSVAAALGIAPGVLMATLAAIFGALAVLLGWMLFRGTVSRRVSTKSDDAPVPDFETEAEDEEPAGPPRKRILDMIAGTRKPRPTNEGAAGEMEHGERDSDNSFASAFGHDELDGEPEQRFGRRDRSGKYATDSDDSEAMQGSVPAGSDPDDPSTWRKPKLDRLRDSIRADWQASKTDDTDPVTGARQTDALANEDLFGADLPDGNDPLFGDESASVASRTATTDDGSLFDFDAAPPTDVNAASDTRHTDRADTKPVSKRDAIAPEDRPLGATGDGWDDWDDTLGEEDDLWLGSETRVPAQQARPEPQADEAAVEARSARQSSAAARIRALRESLGA